MPHGLSFFALLFRLEGLANGLFDVSARARPYARARRRSVRPGASLVGVVLEISASQGKQSGRVSVEVSPGGTVPARVVLREAAPRP